MGEKVVSSERYKHMSFGESGNVICLNAVTGEDIEYQEKGCRAKHISEGQFTAEMEWGYLPFDA